MAVGVLVAVLAACSSGRHHVTGPTTTTAPDPGVVPAVITPAYVNAVFVVLNHVYSDAARRLRVADSVTPEVKADLRAVFNDPVYATQLQAAEQAVQEGIVNNVRLDGGDPVTTVVHLITAQPTCIFVETTTDFRAIEIRRTPTPAAQFYELQPKAVGIDPGSTS